MWLILVISRPFYGFWGDQRLHPADETETHATREHRNFSGDKVFNQLGALHPDALEPRLRTATIT